MKKVLATSLLAVLSLALVPFGRISAQETTNTNPLAGKIVCLDPGHGGTEPGATNGDLLEKEINLDVAERLEASLKAAGATVYMTRRTNDVTLSSRDRYTFCNEKKADIMVSVHTNSVDNPDINGTETYYFHNDDKVLAQYLQDAMLVELGLTDRGIKKAAFGVLLKSKMPSAEVEPVFMSNLVEAEKLQVSCEFGGDCRKQQIAQSLYDGLADYFNSNPEEPSEPGNGKKGNPPGRSK